MRISPLHASRTERVTLIMDLSELKESIGDYLTVLNQVGIDITHIIGFTVHAMSEYTYGFGQTTYLNDPLTQQNSYLAHELISVNPRIYQDRQQFDNILHNAISSIGITLGVMRGLILRATRNPNVSHPLLERFLGERAAVISVNVTETYDHGHVPCFTAAWG